MYAVQYASLEVNIVYDDVLQAIFPQKSIWVEVTQPNHSFDAKNSLEHKQNYINQACKLYRIIMASYQLLLISHHD